MGDRRAHDPASETWWAQTVGERARGAEWDLLHPVDGLPMEGAAERSAAKECAVREQEGREASPTVAIIDSQTAKGTQKGGLGSILRATTRARRSKVASGTSWSTRWVSC